VKQVATLAPEKQADAGRARLREQNPGFDGGSSTGSTAGAVIELRLVTDQVTDLSPLQRCRS